jgi:heme exporter protein D
MAFDSFQAFIEMGGHGPYVWACYIVFFVLSIVLIRWSKRQHRLVLRTLASSGSQPRVTESDGAGADFARVDSSKY